METQDSTKRPASLWRVPQFPYFITHCWLTRPSQMFYFQLFKFWPAFPTVDAKKERERKKNHISSKQMPRLMGTRIDLTHLIIYVVSSHPQSVKTRITHLLSLLNFKHMLDNLMPSRTRTLSSDTLLVLGIQAETLYLWCSLAKHPALNGLQTEWCMPGNTT